MGIMYDTREFRRGLKVLINNDPWSVVDFQHVNPGKGAAFTRLKVKNLRTGQVIEQNIKSGAKLNRFCIFKQNGYDFAINIGFNFIH
jgi:elongation factor P